MRWIRFIVFCLTFALDVQIHAAAINRPSAHSKQLMLSCKNDQSSCLGKVVRGIYKLSTAGADYYFGAKSIFITKPNQPIEIVRGIVRINAKSETVLGSLYGQIFLSAGSVLIEANDKKISFTNLSAILDYQPRGEKLRHNLPAGYATYFSKMTRSGVAEAGIPHPAEIEALVKNWSSVVTKNEYKQFRNEFRNFLVSWRVVSQSVGAWYVDTVQRAIASLRSQEKELARLKAIQDAEDIKMRDMFRKRIFEIQ